MTLKDLGAEFHDAASKLEELRTTIKTAREDRLVFLRELTERLDQSLATHKKRTLELPVEIANYRAEIARLEASTADDLLREAVGEKQETEPVELGMLDLRTVRMESDHADPDVLVADADLYDHGATRSSISQGERFTVERSAAPHGGPRVKVTMAGGSQCFIAAMQPAHVISPAKHACPRCDERMREVRPIGPVVAVIGVRKAIVIDGEGRATVPEGTIESGYYEFVRDDIPPRSEWCDGSGVRS